VTLMIESFSLGNLTNEGTERPGSHKFDKAFDEGVYSMYCISDDGGQAYISQSALDAMRRFTNPRRNCMLYLHCEIRR
jgi:peptide methionine sulfoxide reductase MsrB